MVKLTLDKYLASRQITRYALSRETGIRYAIVDKYYKNKVVRYDGEVLDKICRALDCRISDILVYEGVAAWQIQNRNYRNRYGSRFRIWRIESKFRNYPRRISSQHRLP